MWMVRTMQLLDLFLKALSKYYDVRDGGWTHGLEIHYHGNGYCQMQIRYGKDFVMSQLESTFDKALKVLARRWLSEICGWKRSDPVDMLGEYLVET
jgi:hypothetical protein